jgi:uncharacterized protein (TIGR02996 family)
MSEEAAFLRAIWLAPAADGPWLVFADWLDEQGDPFAEYIRLKCAPRPVTEAERRGRDRRLYELHVAHEGGWTGPGHWLMDNREFAAELAVQIVASRPALPWLRNRRDKLGGVRAAAALAVCPLLEQLTQIDLCYTGLTGDAVAALVTSEHLRHLDWLNLSWNDLKDTGAIAVAHSPHLANLVHLDLSYCRIESDGAQALARSPHLNRLTWLGLECNPQVKDPDERALVKRFGARVCRF